MDANEINSLVISSRNGDNTSILKLFQIYRPFLNNFLRTINTNLFDLDDLMQDCYLTLITCIKSYNFNYPFTAYYTKSVKNNIYNLLKHSNESKTIHLNTDFISEEKSFDDILIQKIDIQKLYSCLNSLKEDDRNLLLDLYFNELSLTDIAKNNDLKYITLVKKKDRLISKLKKSMK